MESHVFMQPQKHTYNVEYFQKQITMTINDSVKTYLSNALAYCRFTRQCEVVEDLDFLLTGVSRVIEKHPSGRAFLQNLQDDDDKEEIARATYFQGLHSGRRRDMTSDCETHLRRSLHNEMKAKGIDHLAAFKELKGYDILAYDGHFHSHACHAPKDDKNRYRAVGGIYAMDLRYGLIQRVVTTDYDTNKTHELKAFRDTYSPKTLKGNRNKTIVVTDMAYIDTKYWDQCRKIKARGIYFISLLKDNLTIKHSEPLAFDQNHDYNDGVQSDSRITLASGDNFRKVDYTDPETGIKRSFLTTVFDVPPGLIAFLYLWRWKIEKIFNVFKSKLGEIKAWANGKIAVDTQASFIAMAYNILLAVKDITLADEGIEEDKLQEKWEKSIQKKKENAEKLGRYLPALAQIPHKLHQMSEQFIRCFRNNFVSNARWIDCVPKFQRAMGAYL